MNLRPEWKSKKTETEMQLDQFYTVEETVNDVKANFDFRRYYSAEGEDIYLGVNAESELIRCLLQTSNNPLNELKDVRKIHVPIETDIDMGNYVFYDNSVWICVSKVVNVGNAYKSILMRRCNFCCRWQNSKGEIIERYGISEDGTSYSNGENEGKILTTVDFQQIVQFPLDSETFLLDTGKRIMVYFKDRDKIKILADNKISVPVMELTKRNAINGTYDDRGIIRFTYTEVTYDSETDIIYDDKYNGKYDLICNVKYVEEEFEAPSQPTEDKGYARIVYKSNVVKEGGSAKTYTPKFYMNEIEIEDAVVPVWDISVGYEKYLTVKSDGTCSIKIPYGSNEVGNTITLSLSDANGEYIADSILIEIDSL